MHFWELCLMKNTLFLKKNGEKIRFFIAFSAIFRDFCEIEKNSQVQIFWAFLRGDPVNTWGDHGQIMGDHGQIMGRSWAMLGFGGFSQLTAGFWWVFAAYGWVFRLACWVFLPYGWVFRSACWVLLPYGCLLEKKTVFFGWVFLIKTNWVGPDPRF